jgi:hypothetical protein
MGKVVRTKVNADSDLADYTGDGDIPGDVESAELDRTTAIVSRELNRSAKSPVGSGWGAPAEERRETVKSPNLVLKDAGKRILKLLDEMPPVKYKRHYINSKKRYYTCPQTECPICKAGVRASWTFVMNVVDMTDDPSEVKTWTFGNEVAAQLQSLAEDKALDDPLQYFQVYHEKIANRDAPATRVQRLKARDLQEDHSIEPLTEDEILALEDERFGEEIVFINTRDYLEGIAEDVVPGDLPQKRAR